MITVSLFGGLGNQMFQYAAGKALAERHSVPLLLDITGFRAHPERSFLLDRFRVPEAGKEGGASALSSGEGYFFAARRSARVARVLASAGLVWPRSVHDYREPHFHFDPTFKRLGAGTRLFGYFQSERYFEAIADRMRAYFIPVAPLSASAQTFVERITASALPVSLHVRRGDYLQPATRAVHGLLDEAYYRRALARMDATLGQTSELFVFSDDPEAASRVLNFLPPARMISIQCEPDRPWEDLALMSLCRHHIVANSSFSWWGAWLNQYADKVVVAPRSWFTEKALATHDTRDLYPPGWIVV